MSDTLPVSCLERHLDNVRRSIEQKGLEPLVANLKELGQLVPLIVFPHPEKKGKYIVADGNRRLVAMLQAGIQEAKCVVLDAEPDPFDLLAMQVALGNTGEKIKPLDTADAAQKIMAAKPALSQKQVAAKLGVSAPVLSNCLNASTHLAPCLRERVASGALPISCAFSLARLRENHAAQVELANLYAAERLTRDSLDERVKKILGKKIPKRKPHKFPLGDGSMLIMPGDATPQHGEGVAAKLVEAFKKAFRLGLGMESVPSILKTG